MATLHSSSWEIENVGCVIFDKDGTLLDGNIFWGDIIVKRAIHIIRYFGLNINSLNELCLSMGYSIKSGRLLSGGPVGIAPREKVVEIVVEYLASIKIDTSISEIGHIFQEVHSQLSTDDNFQMKILPGVKKLFDSLKKFSIKISIVTSDTELNTVKFLKQYELMSHVDLVIGRETTIMHKNTGIPAIIAIEKLDINSNAVVCVGDAPMDLIMSESANCLASVGVLTGQTSEKDLKLHTQFVVETLDYLLIKN
jgi:phosphoglycolate phosphatase-like HAD superfamily hydrolase